MKNKKILEILDAAGYDPFEHEGEIRLFISDGKQGNGEEVDGSWALEHIQSIVEPLGFEADWTGDGNTDKYGNSTSDIFVRLNREEV